MFEYILIALLQGSPTPVVEKFSSKESCEMIKLELEIMGGGQSKVKCIPVMKGKQ